MANTAEATWTGALKDGSGRVRLGRGAFEGEYSFVSRFEDGQGTNPEELIAAAHAACFSMATSGALGRAGIEPESVHTSADVRLRIAHGESTVHRIVLTTVVKAPGADEAKVREAAEAARTDCPISRALAGVEHVDLELTVES